VRRLAIAALISIGVLGIVAGSTSAAPAQGVVASSDQGADDAVAQSDSAAREDAAADLAPVDVLQVTGLFDEIIVDEIENAIDRARENDSQALVLQVNSRASVVGRDAMSDLYELIAESDVPIAIWVGPSGARLYGLPAQLLAAADASGMAPGARIGQMGTPLDDSVDFGAAQDRMRNDSLDFQEARTLGVLKLNTTDEGAPGINSMVAALDGLEVPGGQLDTAVEVVSEEGNVETAVTTLRFFKLGLVAQMMHTVASPAVAYLLLIIGLALLVFELFTAGVGVAGFVGATCLILGCYGVGALPVRDWALAFLLLSMVAFSIDVQVGLPRFWTGVGLVLFIVGSVFFVAPSDGQTLRPSWLTLLVGIVGIALTFVSGMPSMVRTRFATPTIGREWMIGENGQALDAVDPDGVVQVGASRWRARTNRSTPIPAGDAVRVVGIDGVTLEVEPLEGAARDYRERRTSGDTAVEESDEAVAPDA
jgi:membrane-bound serine protease (ClpP class)